MVFTWFSRISSLFSNDFWVWGRDAMMSWCMAMIWWRVYCSWCIMLASSWHHHRHDYQHGHLSHHHITIAAPAYQHDDDVMMSWTSWWSWWSWWPSSPISWSCSSSGPHHDYRVLIITSSSMTSTTTYQHHYHQCQNNNVSSPILSSCYHHVNWQFNDADV